MRQVDFLNSPKVLMGSLRRGGGEWRSKGKHRQTQDNGRQIQMPSLSTSCGLLVLSYLLVKERFHDMRVELSEETLIAVPGNRHGMSSSFSNNTQSPCHWKYTLRTSCDTIYKCHSTCIAGRKDRHALIVWYD